MNTIVTIHSSKPLIIEEFFSFIDIPHLVLDFMTELPTSTHWYFHREGISTTLFGISYNGKGIYEISTDNLAAYDDLKFFPYLSDSFCKFMDGRLETESIYQQMDDDWIEETIAEEIACLKATLSVTSQYFISQPIDDLSFVSLDSLYAFGVNLHSATPRIYGYIQYLMRHHLLPHLNDWNEMDIPESEEEIEVDIPQHISIGKVKSWQLDGSETYESYSQEDVDHLLALADDYRKGKPLHGVVLNDIGTIHQEGIGIAINGKEAIYWFTEAYKAGDALYAPTNLGDLYRKGCGDIKPSLAKAFEAYQLSTDPYAHYRIGQAYEEGWTGVPDIKRATEWYQRAAKEGHHLAIKRIKKEITSSVSSQTTQRGLSDT